MLPVSRSLLAVLYFGVVRILSVQHKDCGPNSVVVLDDADLVFLVQQDILRPSQVEYLYEHYYSSASSDTADSSSEPITVYSALYSVLQGAGCLLLFCAFLLLMYISVNSAKYLVGITCVYHYILHTLLCAMTASTLIPSALLVSCCALPSLVVLIVLYHPNCGAGLDPLRRIYLAIVASLAKHEALVADGQRYDEFIAMLLPNQVLLHSLLLCSLPVVTATLYVYAWALHTFHFKFVLVCVYAWCAYALLMISCLCSLQCFTSLHFKACAYCDARYLYATLLYALCLFLVAYCAHESYASTACMLFALAAFHCSFPAFLFVDVFRLDMGHYIDVFAQLFVGDKKGSLESVREVLGLLQRHDLKYRAFILVLIVLNMAVLELCHVCSSWLPLPFSCAALFVLSLSIATTLKWSLSVHLPIAYSLFKACFAFIAVMNSDTDTNAMLWLLMAVSRAVISVVSCLQIKRAVQWMSIAEQEWRSSNSNSRVGKGRFVSHCAALYAMSCVLLYFGDLEPNYLISWLFVLFALSYEHALLQSLSGCLLEDAHGEGAFVFFVVNLCLSLRLYVMTPNLWMHKLAALAASLVSMALLVKEDDAQEAEEEPSLPSLRNAPETRMAYLFSIAAYIGLGWFYECRWLQLIGVVVLCVFCFVCMERKSLSMMIAGVVVVHASDWM